MKLTIERRLYEQLLHHAERAYPRECCGMLLGRRTEETMHVEQLRPAGNIAADDDREAYQLDWASLLQVLTGDSPGGRRLIGFYHSHPTGPLEPSHRDRVGVWTNLAYVIVAGRPGSRPCAASWWVRTPGSGFGRMSLVVR